MKKAGMILSIINLIVCCIVLVVFIVLLSKEEYSDTNFALFCKKIIIMEAIQFGIGLILVILAGINDSMAIAVLVTIFVGGLGGVFLIIASARSSRQEVYEAQERKKPVMCCECREFFDPKCTFKKQEKGVIRHICFNCYNKLGDYEREYWIKKEQCDECSSTTANEVVFNGARKKLCDDCISRYKEQGKIVSIIKKFGQDASN